MSRQQGSSAAYGTYCPLDVATPSFRGQFRGQFTSGVELASSEQFCTGL